MIPRPRGPSVLAYFSNYGGGLVAGDEINVTIELDASTRCYFATQASTKVYRNTNRLPCGHTLTAKLGRESLLVLAPDPVQAFAGSHYYQHQEFYLERGAGLVLVDWLSSGRAERGERWAFERYESRNEIFVEGRRLVMDSLLLDPADGAIEGKYRMGRFNCLAMMVIIGGELRKIAAELLARFSKLPVRRGAALICSASPMGDGLLIRIAGEHFEEVRKEINQSLDFLPQVLHDDPRARKW
ncbi:MAG TPA: urease accessory protein UreD [Verrucomicrobiae bacterium]|nr:urease accessory protein UreD [Verrucomicrobiae bacterium]